MSALMSKCHDMWKEDMSRGRPTRGDDMQAPAVPGDYGTGGVVDHFRDAGKIVGEASKYDTGKPRMDLIPPEALYALGRVLEYGARKYADRNWEKGFAWGRSVAALKRHLSAWEAGQDFDPESGMPHLWHVLTNAAFLLAFEARGVGTDDRATGCAVHLWGDIRDSRTQDGARG